MSYSLQLYIVETVSKSYAVFSNILSQTYTEEALRKAVQNQHQMPVWVAFCGVVTLLLAFLVFAYFGDKYSPSAGIGAGLFTVFLGMFSTVYLIIKIVQ